MACYEEIDGDIILTVRVVPRASKDGIHGLIGDALKVRIQAPPIEGKANVYLIKFLAKHWQIPRIRIQIVSGATGRNKRLRIHDPTGTVRQALAAISE